MREGAELVTSEQVNRYSLNYIVERLQACCDDFGGVCDGCPDMEVCVDAYDRRCYFEGIPAKKKTRRRKVRISQMISMRPDQSLEAVFDGERFALVEKRDGASKTIIQNLDEAAEYAAFILCNYKVGLTRDEMERKEKQ